MEKLSRHQVLKELQSHKKYKHKTQKEIGEKFKDVDSLRTELKRLEKKNLIYLEGKAYTKEELIKMVNYYTEHVTNVAKISSLNDDVIKEIMLNASMSTIKNLCLTNKSANQYCNSHGFWQEKFKHDHLPPLVVIKKHKDDKGHELGIPSRMKRLPKTVKKWMEAYDKMLWCHQLASKLIDHIIATNIFNEFAFIADERLLLWLPQSMVDYIKNDGQHPIDIYFNIGKTFSLQMIVQDEESEAENETDQIIEMSRQEITAYLTLLFYYEGHDPDFILSSEGDEDAYDNLDKILGMNDFKKPDKHIKSYFPKW